MATKISTLVKIKIATILLVGETSASMQSIVNLIDTSSKASGRASNFEYGRLVETVSVSSIMTTDASIGTHNWKTAQAAQVAATKVAIIISEYDSGGSLVSGAIKIEGTALISNCALEAPDNEKLTFGLDLTFTGATSIGSN